MNNRKLDVSKAQSERHKQILQALLKQEENRRCADCNARGPTWASVNLGLFVCLNCSGHHRSLGVHISKVRSATLDTWLPEQVAFVQQMGNRRANEYWEARLPKDFRRPAEGDMVALAVFIGDKYRNQAYVDQQYREPPTIENFAEHPFMAAEGAKESGVKAAAAEVPSSQVPTGRAPLTRPGAAERAARTPAPAKAEPAADLFDLLRLDEPVPASAPTATLPPAAAGPSVDADHGWAAWDSVEPARGAVAAPPPSANGGALAAVTGLVDHEWDAFQSGDVLTDVTSQPTPRSSDDPFAPAGGIADPFLGGSASTTTGFAAFPDVTTPAKADSPPKKSNDDILKMFDTPRAFGGPGSDPMGGFIPALPSRQGVTPSYMPMQQAAGVPSHLPMPQQAPNFSASFQGMPGYPPFHMGAGTPANFAGLHLHGGPVAAGGGSPITFPNLAGKPGGSPGSLF